MDIVKVRLQVSKPFSIALILLKSAVKKAFDFTGCRVKPTINAKPFTQGCQIYSPWSQTPRSIKPIASLEGYQKLEMGVGMWGRHRIWPAIEVTVPEP